MNNITKPIGLYNINGVTCYINSLLQLLFLCNDFNNEIIEIDRTKYKDKLNYSLTIAYKTIIKKLDNKYKTLKLTLFVNKFKDTYFANEQQDVHEFLIYLFEKISNEIKFPITNNNIKNILSNVYSKKKYMNEIKNNYKDGYSIIDKYFNGLFEKNIYCNKCNHFNKKIEIFNVLECSINNNLDLDSIIQNYFKPEKLDGYKCDNCKEKNTSEKIIKCINTPKYLFIQLKKYDNFMNKLNVNIKFYEYLKLIDYSIKEKCNNFYKLKGIINHLGINMSSGHYTSMVNINNKWFMCDDTNINEIKEEQIYNKNAYILLYEKVEKNNIK